MFAKERGHMSIKMSVVILAALVFALDANAIIRGHMRGRPTDAKLINEGGATDQKAKNAAEKQTRARQRR